MQIIDTAKDPYGRRYFASQKRREFEKLKRTSSFKTWKVAQLKIQNDRCAYCRISLRRENIVTHIDHVQPLFYEGSNDFNNLVLSCRRCNVKKWISDKRVVPDWIKNNAQEHEDKQRLKSLRWKQRKQMEDLVNREIDEQISISMRSWL